MPEGIASLRRSPGLVAAAALVAAVGVFIAWHRTPSADVLWLVDVARRVTRGEVLYRDILEINPPLIVWLLLPFARTGHPLEWFLAATVGLAVASSVLVARALGRPGALVAALALLLVVPIGWFGQREHLAVALILPWLVGALRAGRADPSMPGVPHHHRGTEDTEDGEVASPSPRSPAWASASSRSSWWPTWSWCW